MSSVCVLLLRNQKLEHELRWSGDQAPPPVMNPTTEPPPPPLPQFQQPQPPQRHRRACERHPEEQFTGFCPSCLCDRLAVLEPSSASSSAAPAASASASSSSREPPSSTAASALKALFKPSSSSSSSSKPPPPASASAFPPELRRTKSFSASKNEGFFSGIFEPQRKSCDVRVRSTLFTLFSLDDDRNPSKRDSTRSSNAEGVQAKNLGPAGVRGPVLESKEEEDAGAGSDYQQSKEYIVQEDGEIRAWEEPNVATAVVENRVQEIVEEEEEEEEEEAEIEETAEPELEVVLEEEAMKNTGNLIISSSSLPSEPTIVESTEESHNEKGVKEKIGECSKALLNLESATDTVTHLISDLISMASEEELLKGSGSGLYNQAAELLPTIAHKVDALARLLRLGSNHSIVRN